MLLHHYKSVVILSHRRLVRPQPPRTTTPKWSRTRTRMVRPLSPLSRWGVFLTEAVATSALPRQPTMEEAGEHLVCCLVRPTSQRHPDHMIASVILRWPSMQVTTPG